MERSVIGFKFLGAGSDFEASYGSYLRLFSPVIWQVLEDIYLVDTDYIERLYDITTTPSHYP